MSFGEDEEILQDFIVEAGEILEALSEQFVELENRPSDKELLNAIFRGVHTVKGGGGFLQLNALVDVCHVTENMFDLLRNGKLTVTTDLMDVALQALDVIQAMFGDVQDRVELQPADPALLQKIAQICAGDAIPVPVEEPIAAEEPVETAPPPQAEPTQTQDIAAGDMTDEDFELFVDSIQEPAAQAPVAQAPVDPSKLTAEDVAATNDEISEDEFEALLDQIHGKGKIGNGDQPAAPAPSGAAASEEITEDDFDALLQELHGDAAPGTDKALQKNSARSQAPAIAQSGAPASDDGNISDDEFENLLDQLHGVGKGPKAAPATAAPAPAPKAPQATIIRPKATPKPAAVAAKPAPAAPAPEKAPVAAAVKTGAASGRAKEAPPAAETTVRVDTQRLDDIMNMVGELVLVRNRLVRLGLKSGDEEMSKAVSNLDVVTADLQTSVMKTRMQPIKKVFGRFPRVVRDLARNLKKEITLELQGEETDLDKNLVEALADPLVHLVRNSVDHGVEMPDKREAAGKPRVGKVILAAEQEGDHILLSISDDGYGMDPDVLRKKVVEKGLLDEDAAARLSDTECFDLIFMPGFSTKTEISDVSGRGVGMDVVKTKITQLNGSIEIQSALGEGTRIIIKVPLTLAIMPTLMVMLGAQTFALPLVSVNEIFHMDLTRTNVVDGQEVVTVREKALPLFYLKRWLVEDAFEAEQPNTAHVVIVSVGSQRVGFVVDSLIGQEEVVIKPLGKMLQGTPGMAGATITGDGRIALILDVPSMLKRYVG